MRGRESKTQREGDRRKERKREGEGGRTDRKRERGRDKDREGEIAHNTTLLELSQLLNGVCIIRTHSNRQRLHSETPFVK